jgi:pimeloyl-ACP methyl ester carboxylesterase
MKKSILVTVLVLAGLLVLMDSCMQFRMTTTEIDQQFAKTNTLGSREEYKVGNRKIHYAKTGNPDGPLVLFIHGSPGSLSDFIQFLTDSALQQKSLLISVDRPGFGQSNFGWGEPSLAVQANAIKPLIEQYKRDKPVILIGHSLGGPLIAQMALDYPELVDGLIFVAGSVDPKLEPPNWWRTPFATPYFRWMLPRSIRASNDEIYPLRVQLEEMEPRWKDIKCKVIVVQGTKDSLVPVGNAEFIRSHLTSTTPKMVYEEGMDHFVPWSHPQLIKNAVVEMVGILSKSN